MSLFIALEGLDASGKHTQTEKLKKHFEDSGFETIKFDFPNYKSITGEMISGHLQGDWKIHVSDEAKTMLYDPMRTKDMPEYMVNPSTYLFQCCQLVNRMETLPDDVWEPDHKKVFIADRYNASAYAYGIAFDLNFDWLVRSHRHLPQPDINIFLDISVEESFRRRPNRRDDYEKNSKLLERVRNCYIDVFKRLGSSYVIIDGSGSEEQVFEKILDVIDGLPR